ncbi:hypothetical protein TWF694_003996 [Orbilia ellipsospora]|uniref:Rhodopsin domain-containing protein n=1 Tax=Orbilia ellipsospora TaxID=2528407 RepID=A0AAV9WWS5_9PEZI
MGLPPHPQTEADREYLMSLFPLFKELPSNFQFPLEVDPNYIPPINSFYCLVVGVIMCIITVIVVCLRLWIRSRGTFGMDDWVMLAAFVSYAAFNCVNLVAVLDTGLGYHVYDLSRLDIHNYLIMQFLHVIFWFCALHLCRCSILHLFLRLAHLQSENQKLYLHTVLTLSYIFLAGCVFVQIFECGLPVSNSFELKLQFDGTCVGTNSVAVYGGLIAGHMALDALTIFPPLFILARLPLAPGKKFNLIFLLILGVFTMVFSAVRLFVFYNIMVSSFDITWHATAVAFWGILESSLAAIIACLPALNQAMIKFAKRVYHHSQTGSRRSRSRSSRSRRSPGTTAVSTRFRISLFERSHIYRGPSKFVSYSADATTTAAGTTRDYVELGDVQSNSPKSPDEMGRMNETAGDSYPDISVERNYYVTEERASDLEAQMEGSEGSGNQSSSSLAITKPSRIRTFLRRPSSPTLPMSPAHREPASQIPSLPPLPPLPAEVEVEFDADYSMSGK